MTEVKEVLKFENRGWSEARHKRLVSNRVEIPPLLVYQFSHATSMVFEVSTHAQYGGDYVIKAYAYSTPEKRPGKLDPCTGGLVKNSHYEDKPITFKGWRWALDYIRDRYGFVVEVAE